MIFNLSSLGKEVLTRYEFGQAIRKQLNLDKEEKKHSSITFIIPSSLYSISSSFLKGLLEKSIKQFDNKAQFYQKFKFEGEPIFLGVLDSIVIRVFQEKAFDVEYAKKMNWFQKLLKKMSWN